MACDEKYYETQIIEIDENNIDANKMERAAEIIRKGGTVIFPTETVYGLGAAAMIPEAVNKIFKAKGRPADNPLIVHVSNKDMIEELISNKNLLKQNDYIKLMEAFWPGPLTIIFPKNPVLCDEVTAGLPTVGIRMPENKAALALINAASVGIAAPSANTSGKPSPTRVKHVIEDMQGKVDMIISGGNCKVGIESTVLDMTQTPPVILRPGGVTKSQIEKVLNKNILSAKNIQENEDYVPKAPGMKYTHYAPKGEVIIFYGREEKVAEQINSMYEEALEKGVIPHIIASKHTICYYKDKYSTIFGEKENPGTYAESLFDVLRHCDECGAEIIFIEAVPEDGIGEAVMNRLLKAAGYRIIDADKREEL